MLWLFRPGSEHHGRARFGKGSRDRDPRQAPKPRSALGDYAVIRLTMGTRPTRQFPNTEVLLLPDQAARAQRLTAQIGGSSSPSLVLSYLAPRGPVASPLRRASVLARHHESSGRDRTFSYCASLVRRWSAAGDYAVITWATAALSTITRM
jgi:hypothetical protein